MAPTAFRAIGWKFYLVFIIAAAVAFTWAYFMVPETKGLPLEEVAALFGGEGEVTVFAANIHVDHTNNGLVVKDLGEVEHNDKGNREPSPESRTVQHVESM